jgi:uncharacterized protein
MSVIDQATRPGAAAGPDTGLGSRRPDWRFVVPALILVFGGALYLTQAYDGRQAALYLLGGALGLVLFRAAFGFASSWRVFLSDGRGAGLRAQMLMLALASAIFLPALAQGTLFGQPVGGAVAPVGVSVLFGAFLFGIGMQLGGGCASGTLFTVGGGSTNMVVTLIFFAVGSLLGSASLPWWLAQPSFGSISLLKVFGLTGALALQFALFALIVGVSVLVERRRHGHIAPGFTPTAGSGAPRPGLARRMMLGPWPLLWGAVLLALLNAATLYTAGHPWNVSFGYTLWGAKAAAALGVDVASWDFWTWRYPKRALAGGLLEETTSLMNFGILAGAFLAAGLAGRFAPKARIGLRVAAGAVLGGLLMGFGARLAFGCNIGALFSGIASGSVHGWLWFVAALAGTYIGAFLRPSFGLAVEGRPVSTGG